MWDWLLWSISPTFYERICANILASKKVQTLNVSTEKFWAKLSNEKGACKMLVKLTSGHSKVLSAFAIGFTQSKTKSDWSTESCRTQNQLRKKERFSLNGWLTMLPKYLMRILRFTLLLTNNMSGFIGSSPWFREPLGHKSKRI